jgi:reactive intermediate/imine deaminase
MTKQKIHSEQAPQAIGTYSQAIRSGNTVYLSGQIPLDPQTMTLAAKDFAAQAAQVFKNLQEVCKAAGGNVDDIVKLTIYLTNLTHFSIVNETMKEYFNEPYPARSTIEISALPKAALIEIDAIMVLNL